MNIKSLILFGPLNKKLLIPFLLALNQILYNIFELYYPGKTNQIFESYSTSIGHMLILIIPHIKFFSTKEKEYTSKIGLMNQNYCSKNFCHYLILIVLYNIETILLFINSLIDKNNENVKLPHEHGPFTKESFTIILIAIASYFFFKSKNYSHNIVSIGFFIIMALLMDFIFNNFENEYSGSDFKNFIINFAIILFEVINFCYQKYMIDNLYHYYYNVVFALGLDLFICNTISLPAFLLNEKLKKRFLESFDDLQFLIPRFFIVMIFQFIYFLLRILTLVYYTPTHLLICLSLSKFIVSLIDKGSNLKYISIIPFLFQFFSLMVYLEIIELNFCGLNKNTKRNIALREEQDMLLGINNRNTIDEDIETSPGYYINAPPARDTKNRNTAQNDVMNIEMKSAQDKFDWD